jgi:hypothetical protein
VPEFQQKPCPLCGEPVDQQWFTPVDAFHVQDCPNCDSPIVHRAMILELNQARRGRGLLAGRLEELSRATQAGAISELKHVAQVVAELNEFLEDEAL